MANMVSPVTSRSITFFFKNGVEKTFHDISYLSKDEYAIQFQRRGDNDIHEWVEDYYFYTDDILYYYESRFYDVEGN